MFGRRKKVEHEASEHGPLEEELQLTVPPSNTQISHQSQQLTHSVLQGSGDATQVRAVVRIRPMNDMEYQRSNNQKVVRSTDDHKAIQMYLPDGKISAIAFDSTYDEETSQTEFFEDSGVHDLILQALSGYAATVFAFGQTGSGKTFTITGPEGQQTADSVGMVPRALNFIFSSVTQLLQSQQLISARVQASYLEIYNEHVQDLLNVSNSNLPVRWTAERGFYVENLFIVDCDVLDDCLAVLEEGLRNRTTAAHAMNEHSSRSHSVLTIYFETVSVDEAEQRPVKRHGKISFVDLAGSEKVKESKATGETFNEALSINKSLLTLGQCISALSDPKKRNGHIPFRDSKLTKLLCDSLGGNGIALMIACISPSYSNLQETIKTLRYASRARNIENKPVVQLDPKEEIVMILKREIQSLKKENAQLRAMIDDPKMKDMMPELFSPSRINAKSATAHRSSNFVRESYVPPNTQTEYATPFTTVMSPLADMPGSAHPNSVPGQARVSMAPGTNGDPNSNEKYRSTPFTSKGNQKPPTTPNRGRSEKRGSQANVRSASNSKQRAKDAANRPPSMSRQRVKSLKRSDAPLGSEKLTSVPLPYGKKPKSDPRPDEDEDDDDLDESKVSSSSVKLPPLPIEKKSSLKGPPSKKNNKVDKKLATTIEPPQTIAAAKKAAAEAKKARPSGRSPPPTLRKGLSAEDTRMKSEKEELPKSSKKPGLTIATSPVPASVTNPPSRIARTPPGKLPVINQPVNREQLLQDVQSLDKEIGKMSNPKEQKKKK